MLWRSICFQSPRARRLRNSRRDLGATFSGDLLNEGGLSQPSNLFHVVQPVHEMKFFPLACGEGAEDGMVQHLAARAKVLFTAGNGVVHFGDFCPNLGQHLFWRQSARTRDGRGFPARGQISEGDDDQCAAALRPGLCCDQRLAGCGHALKSLHRSGVGQIQVLQNLGGAPLSRRMPAQLLGRQSDDGRCDLLLQSLETRVHKGLLTFSVLSVRMLRDK
jgi:hypothetical protein